jgi:hypothetical protein
MSKKGKKQKKKVERETSTKLSDILPKESLDLLEKLKKDLRKKEKKHKYTKQGIKRLDNVKRKKRGKSDKRHK